MGTPLCGSKLSSQAAGRGTTPALSHCKLTPPKPRIDFPWLHSPHTNPGQGLVWAISLSATPWD